MKYRSRIKENFSEELLERIKKVINSSGKLSNNDKFNVILDILSPYDFIELAAGTNRMAVLKNEYVFKIALDSYGIKDNWQEYNYSKELQPYVTKTYECNGIIAVAEYVTLITQREFQDSTTALNTILSILSKNYIFEDIGTISKNFCNVGYREDGSLVILDYGYIYKKDPTVMFCEKCGGPLVYNSSYSKLLCSLCGKSVKVSEIKNRMEADQSDYDKIEVSKEDFFIGVC